MTTTVKTCTLRLRVVVVASEVCEVVVVAVGVADQWSVCVADQWSVCGRNDVAVVSDDDVRLLGNTRRTVTLVTRTH